MDKKETIRKFVVKTFLKGNKSVNLTDDSSFFEEGIIDSLGALELISFIEKTFGFKAQDSELIPENLDSINKINAYVNSKLVRVEALR